MYTRNIRQWLNNLKEGDLILAKQVYEESFTQMKEATFYQLLARLCQNGVIGKIAKGLYYKFYKNDLEALPSEEQLISFFTNKNRNGMIVGAQMMKSLGILDGEHEMTEILTNAIEIKTRRCIANLVIRFVDVDFKNPKILNTIQALELIEILDDYDSINKNALKSFFEEFATNFDIQIYNKVLAAKNYKKRNIYGVKILLDYYNVPNQLNRSLNTASKYSLPKVFSEIFN